MAPRSSIKPSKFNLSRFVLSSILWLTLLLCTSLAFLAACAPAPTGPQEGPAEAEEATAETAVTAAPEESPKATPTPIPSPTSAEESLPTMTMPLPRGIVPEPVELHYGPKHPTMVILPAGAEFVLLGKNRREEKLDEGAWFRVQIDNGPEAGRVGWIRAERSSPKTLAANTNAIASPPDCAKALANSMDDFEGTDRSDGTMGIWRSSYTGDTAFVIDIYRQIAGELSPKLVFILEANGRRIALPEEIKPSRKSFIWRGLIVHADLNQGERVRLILQAPNGTIPEEISWFVSAYSVPRDCQFD